MNEAPHPVPSSVALADMATWWECSVPDAHHRLVLLTARVLTAAGADLAGTSLVPSQLADLILRCELAAFDDLVRAACRRSTMQQGTYPSVVDFQRWGFQDDGRLRVIQARIIKARESAEKTTTAGVLAAVDYAGAMCDFCERKRQLLQGRTSASFLGYMTVEQSTADAEGEFRKREQRPFSYWRIMGAVLVAAGVVVILVWLLMTRH